MKKTLYAILFITISAMGVYWYTTPMTLNTYIQQQIESQGTSVIGQDLSIKSVDIKILDGLGIVRGLNVQNDNTAENKNLLYIDKIGIDIDITSLTTQPYIINTLTISGMKVHATLSKKGLIKILPRLNNNAQSTGDDTAFSTENSAVQKRILIKSIVFKDINVSLDLSILNQGTKAFTLKSLTLKNIGEKDGTPVDKIGVVLSKRILESVKNKIEDTQKKEIENKVKKKLKYILKDKLNKFIK